MFFHKINIYHVFTLFQAKERQLTLQKTTHPQHKKSKGNGKWEHEMGDKEIQWITSKPDEDKKMR